MSKIIITIKKFINSIIKIFIQSNQTIKNNKINKLIVKCFCYNTEHQLVSKISLYDRYIDILQANQPFIYIFNYLTSWLTNYLTNCLPNYSNNKLINYLSIYLLIDLLIYLSIVLLNISLFLKSFHLYYINKCILFIFIYLYIYLTIRPFLIFYLSKYLSNQLSNQPIKQLNNQSINQLANDLTIEPSNELTNQIDSKFPNIDKLLYISTSICEFKFIKIKKYVYPSSHLINQSNGVTNQQINGLPNGTTTGQTNYPSFTIVSTSKLPIVTPVRFTIEITARDNNDNILRWHIKKSFDDFSILYERLRLSYSYLSIPKLTSIRRVIKQAIERIDKQTDREIDNDTTNIPVRLSTILNKEKEKEIYTSTRAISKLDSKIDSKVDKKSENKLDSKIDSKVERKADKEIDIKLDRYIVRETEGEVDTFDSVVWMIQQNEILKWLRQLQYHLTLCDDPRLRIYLSMPPDYLNDNSENLYIDEDLITDSPKVKKQNSSISGFFRSLSLRPTLTNSTNTPTNDIKVDSVVDIKKDIKADSKLDNKIDSKTDSKVVITTNIEVKNQSSEDTIYSSNDIYNITWRGNDSKTIEFLDQSPVSKQMYYDCSYSHNYKLRGLKYMTDKKKIDAGASISKLLLMEVYEVESDPSTNKTNRPDRIDHIASKGRVKRRLEILNSLSDKPFIFIMNIQIPGDPPVNVVTYHIIPDYLMQSNDSPITEALNNDLKKLKKLFDSYIDVPRKTKERLDIWGVSRPKQSNSKVDSNLDSKSIDQIDEKQLDDCNDDDDDDDLTPVDFDYKKAGLVKGDVVYASPYSPGALPLTSFQNKRFKLIPAMVDGPWVVKMAVRSTPVLLGQKVAQRYFRGDNYIETDIHVGSSMIASQIVGVCRSYVTAFICNIGVVLQGESEDELPEQLLTCIALNKVDVNIRTHLYR